MALDQVTERSAARLTVSFFDFDGAASAPTSITYEVHDEHSETELRAATAVSPASVVQITLDSTDTQVVNSALAVEQRRVLIRATYSAGDEVNGLFRFEVLNLANLTGT